ncbi:MAG: PD40 domain-containing protein [Bacteroidetes bacterium]|nr:PD40 domain-containing protein [Bacteroidota bacterium]
MKKFIPFLILTVISIYIFTGSKNINTSKISEDTLYFEGEKHLKNIKQLTFGGENAEAYFSFDGKKLSFQSTREGRDCDQIYKMNIDGSEQTLVSTGKGRTTCAYYMPDNKHILFASTHLVSDLCPPKPDLRKGYVWALYDSYDIFVATEQGEIVKQLTNEKAYDAEATISPLGDRIVFTSTRNGDIDLYSMNLDGTDIKQLTDELGYDGGAFYSYDGKKIIYRRTRFENDEAKEKYKELLGQGLIRPTLLDIYVMDADGSNKTRITHNTSANFAPYFFPDGKRILFCSNIEDPQGRNFDVYAINIDGTNLEKITNCPEFDGFPMFSPDGKKLVFCSNRNDRIKGETNVFICDWVD